LKLKELHLTHEYAEKKQQEAEEQRAIREQMREEEKAQRELERAQLEAEREAERYQSALQKAQRDAEKAQGEKLNKLNAEIERLSQLVTDANARKERAISQAQLTKSGYVYIISNVGSFGEEVYKIGMTRRLDPMDRVHELGDASVPFAFDVHAMVYSEDAPGLENLLHRSFDQRRVNLVNTKKEFFRVALDEIREVVTKHHAGEVKYTLVAEALEFRKSQGMRALGQGPIRAPQSGRAAARA
jgi:DNA repair exonuclease SbcCD ATPase subunit